MRPLGEIDPAKNWPVGQYMGECGKCSERFIGPKLSATCYPCWKGAQSRPSVNLLSALVEKARAEPPFRVVPKNPEDPDSVRVAEFMNRMLETPEGMSSAWAEFDRAIAHMQSRAEGVDQS